MKRVMIVILLAVGAGPTSKVVLARSEYVPLEQAGGEESAPPAPARPATAASAARA